MGDATPIDRRPTLQEIADMPHSACISACRKWLHPRWGEPVEGDGETKLFKVKVNYSVPDSRTYQVEAMNEQEAEDLACDQFWKEMRGFDIDGCEVSHAN